MESALFLAPAYQNPASLEVSPGSAGLNVGGTATLSATGEDVNRHAVRLAQGDRGGLVAYRETSEADREMVDGGQTTGRRRRAPLRGWAVSRLRAGTIARAQTVRRATEGRLVEAAPHMAEPEGTAVRLQAARLLSRLSAHREFGFLAGLGGLPRCVGGLGRLGELTA